MEFKLKDHVRRPDDLAMGNVWAILPGGWIVVRWPNLTYSRHKPRDLLPVGSSVKPK